MSVTGQHVNVWQKWSLSSLLEEPQGLQEKDGEKPLPLLYVSPKVKTAQFKLQRSWNWTTKTFLGLRTFSPSLTFAQQAPAPLPLQSPPCAELCWPSAHTWGIKGTPQNPGQPRVQVSPGGSVSPWDYGTCVKQRPAMAQRAQLGLGQRQ